MIRFLVSLAMVVTALALPISAIAGSGPADLPPNWHIHDGQTALGPHHKAIGFFPAILTGGNTTAYLQDPASCPDATDKVFLPQGRQDGQPLRAGVCMTSDQVVHLHTVTAGTAGPAGWASITTPAEPGWVTYYMVTDR